MLRTLHLIVYWGLLAMPTHLHADVYLDRPVVRLDSLANVLKSRAAGQARRSMVVNGIAFQADMLHVSLNYAKALKQVASRRAIQYAQRLEPDNDLFEVLKLLHEPRVIRGDGWMGLVDHRLGNALKEQVSAEERPRVILSIERDTNQATLWEMQFRNTTDLVGLLIEDEGGQIEHPLSLLAFPGAKTTFRLSEYGQDMEWHLATFRGEGRASDHVSHYADQLALQGLTEDRTSISGEAERHVYLSGAGKEATVASSRMPDGSVYDVVQISIETMGGGQ